MRSTKTLTKLIAVAIGASTLAACGAGASQIPSNGSRKIVIFQSPTTISYIAAWVKGAKAEGKKLGYDVTIIENSFDQAQENSQVQQQLAKKEKVVAYGFNPVDEKVGLVSARALMKTGVPVGQLITQPTKDYVDTVSLYTGTNFVANGETSVKQAYAARDTLRDSGATLHGAKGTLAILSWPKALTISQEKEAGLKAGLAQGDTFSSVSTTYGNGVDNAAGFEAMSAALATSKGNIDVVYAYNDAMAVGAVQSLKAAGKKPGKDVLVVGGNCHGDTSALVSGEQYSSILVAGELEGRYWMQTMDRLIKAGGKAKSGADEPSAEGNSIPSGSGAPHQLNYLPQPAVTFGSADAAKNQAQLQDSTLWGQTFEQACSY